jgi:hypothetical protein
MKSVEVAMVMVLLIQSRPPSTTRSGAVYSAKRLRVANPGAFTFDGEINGHGVKCLLDTGAERTMISGKIVGILGLGDGIQNIKPIIAEGFNGKTSVMDKQVVADLIVVYHEKRLTLRRLKFLIAEDENQHIIIGSSDMHLFNVPTIDELLEEITSGDKVIIKDETITVAEGCRGGYDSLDEEQVDIAKPEVICDVQDIIGLEKYKDSFREELIQGDVMIVSPIVESLKDSRSIPGPCVVRRYSEDQTQFLDDFLSRMCHAQIIERSESAITSPVVLARKKDE